MSTVRWSDIRDKHVEAIGREDVERGTSRLIAQVRAHRLANMQAARPNPARSRPGDGGDHRTGQPDRNGELSGIDVLTVTSPLSAASSKSSRTSVTNSSRSAERRS